MTPARETWLTARDRRQLTAHGIAVRTIARHMETLRRGTPCARLARPCTLHDGIRRLRPSETPALLRQFDTAAAAGRVMYFIPASGAATRMFHALHVRRLEPDAARVSTEDRRALRRFFSELPKFAFYNDLARALARRGLRLDRARSKEHDRRVLDALLDAPGLHYAGLPKGLIAFHRYPDSTRTPIEEHLVDAAACAKDAAGRVRLHLTIAPAHRDAVRRHLHRACRALAGRAAAWHARCSVQHPSTDTIAVGPDNRPFHDARGNLLFRPTGHGALLPNLCALGGDVVCIRNIDNVVPDHLKARAHHWQRALGGLLVDLQHTLFAVLRELESGTASAAAITRGAEWARRTLAVTMPGHWRALGAAQRARWLFDRLHRPLRVCGMVPRAGDPGGGPFWVERMDDAGALQIVERAQVSPDDPRQRDIFDASTHFNPVELVCGVRDYRGRRFDLRRFADFDAEWIARKSHDGQPVKSLERAGLWNGAMAKWHSVFVEMPRRTFNPVKALPDLLRPAHQPPPRA